MLLKPNSWFCHVLTESMVPKRYCADLNCPIELLHPLEDCNVNASLSFTVQICRVENVMVEGYMEGSVINFHWARTVIVKSSGVINASGLGCIGGLGKGEMLPYSHFSGAGHGGRGGDTYIDGNYILGGNTYGDADLPCEFGSGSGNFGMPGTAAGGGIIVMGSLEHSLFYLSIDGSLQANGASSTTKFMRVKDGGYISDIVVGGGSGGTILLFVRTLTLGNSSVISAAGGFGSTNGGGGGGGRVHFHWLDIPTGDEYLPVAKVEGIVSVGGGNGGGHGRDGESGSISGKACPEGLYGIFCQECPIGTYKNTTGSDRGLCLECPRNELPHRAMYVAVRGGVTDTPCPYKCISERYHLPHCLTKFEEFMHLFDSPWIFGCFLLSILILLALIISVARVKLISAYEAPALTRVQHGSSIDHPFSLLDPLNEELETHQMKESQTHLHRMYFMGCNTHSEPWHLLHSPPKDVTEIVNEAAFSRFVDKINSLASYNWWEGSLYWIFFVVGYPFAWSWQYFCQKKKMQHLREFVQLEYDYACLHSIRSRALHKGLKVAATSDLMLGYVDFFLGGDEKRSYLPRLNQRFPTCIIFSGDGSYMAPFSLYSDNILNNLMNQLVPPNIWYRFVAGLNAQLRLVCKGHLRSTFCQVMNWLETHANPTLKAHGVRVAITCLQPSPSGYRQFGLVVCAIEDEAIKSTAETSNQVPGFAKQSSCKLPGALWRKAFVLVNEQAGIQKRIPGEVLNVNNLQTLREKMMTSFPFYFIISNTKPIGHQGLVEFVISALLLADFSLVMLTLLQLYSNSLLEFILVLSILPHAIVLPFPAGIVALFSHEPRRSAFLLRLYSLLNITSVINIVIAVLCGFLHLEIQHMLSKNRPPESWNFFMEVRGWWTLPFGQVMCKVFQARMINYHVANLEIQDHTLYSMDPVGFWR